MNTLIQTAESCEKCRFFMPEPDDMQKGRCRRFPRNRSVNLMQNVAGQTVPLESADFPQAARNDWCGEYVKAEMPAAAGSA